MAIGDRWVVVTKMDYQGQTALNIFSYLQTAGTGTALSVYNAFVNRVTGVLMNSLHSTVYLKSVLAYNAGDETDFYNNDPFLFGGITGEGLPTHDCISFQYVPNRLDCRSGAKRFVGVPETRQNNGVPSPSYVTQCNLLAAVLESNIDYIANAYRPVIYGGRTGSLGKFNNPLSTVQFKGLFTQNSRKTYTNGIF